MIPGSAPVAARSDDLKLDVDVASCCVRVWADLVCLLDQGKCCVVFERWNDNVEFDCQPEAAGVHGESLLHRNLHRLGGYGVGGEAQRAELLLRQRAARGNAAIDAPNPPQRRRSRVAMMAIGRRDACPVEFASPEFIPGCPLMVGRMSLRPQSSHGSIATTACIVSDIAKRPRRAAS